MKFIKTFLSDDDGLSQKDFLLITTTIVFFGLIIFGTVEWVRGKDIAGLLSLIESMSGVTITVVGGIMGVNALQIYSQGKQQNVNYTPNQMNGYNPYNNSYYNPNMYNNLNNNVSPINSATPINSSNNSTSNSKPTI
jgi:hypothetical protein